MDNVKVRQLVQLDDETYVVNGRCVRSVPNLFDIKNGSDVDELVKTAEYMGSDDPMLQLCYPMIYGDDTYVRLFVSSGSGMLSASVGDIDALPEDLRTRVRSLINEYQGF